MSEDLKPGLYDHLITRGLARRLERLPDGLTADRAPLDPGESHAYLARHLAASLNELLRLVDKEGSDRIRAQAAAYNAALNTFTNGRAERELIAELPELLAEIRGVRDAARRTRPIVPLGTSALLVNDDQLLSAAAVLKREIGSADRVDLICAFVNYTGVRILEEEIRSLCKRGAMRLITTTYMGATQRRALDALAQWGVQVRVTYEAPPANTKLHAKAWIFHRHSGADTAMVGSSNLSHSALMDGLEWNVRLSRLETPQLLDRFDSTFERYWPDPTFEPYDPRADADRLDRALRVCGKQETTDGPLLFLDVQPRPHQRDILESLAADRDRGHTCNLVVAATGTGKTIVAALDYKRLCADGRRPSLLFVAHRAEILNQSLNAFRTVLRDGSFGELWVAGSRPVEGRHVFASIQSLHDTALAAVDPERYEIVIVDEFHHAEAPTYRRLMEHLRPHLLIGLTATPERTDGVNVMKFFGDRVTYEMRLWDALEDQLLCPFQYFGIADMCDLSTVAWSRGCYAPEELERQYLERGADGAALVLHWIEKIVTDWRRMRALGFCVGIRHATFLAEEFNRRGVSAVALTSQSSPEERTVAIQNLRARRINVIFTVDLFNEGVDIPEADTLLFLRPTESATVFLQQLGRGLRLDEDKPCTTVLDFVGQQHQKFRFDQRFRAITGLSRSALERQVAHGFTALPSGCHIQLDRVTRDRVLENIRTAVPTKTQELVGEYRSLSGGRSDYPLAEFLRETGLTLDDLYRTNRTYASLKRGCSVVTEPLAAEEKRLSCGLVRLLHITDDERLLSLAALLEVTTAPRLEALPLRQQRELYMLASTLISGSTLAQLQESIDRIWSFEHIRRELAELCYLLAESAPPGPIPNGVSSMRDVPVLTHGSYSQDEVVSAFGLANPASMRQGVAYFLEHSCDVFLVTLKKTETEYSPTTRYNDYPISPERFHWESQNATGPETPVGRRYINHAGYGSTVLLFVREEKTGGSGTSPYFCCGPVEYESHHGARPMRIVWRLTHPLPHRQFLAFRAAAG